MKQYLNEKGLSLIEVLATLTMLTIVGALVFGVLINSLQITNHESEQNNIRKEANLINNQLITFYKANNEFSTETDKGKLTVTSASTKKEFSLKGYSIYVNDPTRSNIGTYVDSTSDNLKSGNYISRDIIIEIVNNDDINDIFTLNSTITRVKED